MSVNPEQVLKELAGLWVTLGKQEGEGVLRACGMTLVVAAGETENAQDIWETLAALMPEHPARAILVRGTADDGSMTARVFAQCWMPFGQRRQICCEQIEIAAPQSGFPHLPPVLLPLVATDLPVIFWCRERPLFTPELAAMAAKTVVDSARGFSPEELREWTRAGHAVADLAWTRLTAWREFIAHFFENRDYVARLSGVTELRVTFPGDRPPAEARYMGAWLLECSRAAGANPRLTLEPGEEGVEFRGPDFHFAAVRTSGECAELRAGNLASRVPLPRPAEHALMAEELGITCRDRVFERMLAAI